jgi:hypothetical protein
MVLPLANLAKSSVTKKTLRLQLFAGKAAIENKNQLATFSKVSSYTKSVVGYSQRF